VSGPFPRSWVVSGRAEVHDPDDALCRVWDALDADDANAWDRVEQIVNPLLDALVEAGYVEQWGGSRTGCFGVDTGRKPKTLTSPGVIQANSWNAFPTQSTSVAIAERFHAEWRPMPSP
jgi:hypothetical protein